MALQHRGAVDDIEELDLAVHFLVDIIIMVAMDKIEAIQATRKVVATYLEGIIRSATHAVDMIEVIENRGDNKGGE